MGQPGFNPQGSARRLAGVVGAVVFWLLAQVAAFSPALHHWLHETSQSPQHYCAAVVFQQGQVEPTPSTVAVPPPEAVEFSLPATGPQRLPGQVEWLPPGRGPPVA
jgi:hypothetical protein